MQPDQANEGAIRLVLYRPGAPAVFANQGIATIRQGITLRLGEGRREEGHHAWIGVQGRERHAVCRRPWAKA